MIWKSFVIRFVGKGKDFAEFIRETSSSFQRVGGRCSAHQTTNNKDVPEGTQYDYFFRKNQTNLAKERTDIMPENLALSSVTRLKRQFREHEHAFLSSSSRTPSSCS